MSVEAPVPSTPLGAACLWDPHAGMAREELARDDPVGHVLDMFSGASLSETCLSETCLSETYPSEPCLSETCLSETYPSEPCLSETCLSETCPSEPCLGDVLAWPQQPPAPLSSAAAPHEQGAIEPAPRRRSQSAELATGDPLPPWLQRTGQLGRHRHDSPTEQRWAPPQDPGHSAGVSASSAAPPLRRGKLRQHALSLSVLLASEPLNGVEVRLLRARLAEEELQPACLAAGAASAAADHAQSREQQQNAAEGVVQWKGDSAAGSPASRPGTVAVEGTGSPKCPPCIPGSGGRGMEARLSRAQSECRRPPGASLPAKEWMMDGAPLRTQSEAGTLPAVAMPPRYPRSQSSDAPDKEPRPADARLAKGRLPRKSSLKATVSPSEGPKKVQFKEMVEVRRFVPRKVTPGLIVSLAAQEDAAITV